MKQKKTLFSLICFAIILIIAVPLWSAVAKASPAVEGLSGPTPDLQAAANSPVVSLTGGWNLISLPIMPLNTSIENVLAPLAYPYDLISVWHYDTCGDEWLAHGEGHTSLETMEAGKAYWVRMRHPDEQHWDPAVSGTYPYTLWLFGTKTPMPPSMPAGHEVCAGWNMVGFTSTEEMAPEDYLRSFSPSEYGPIYGWDPYLADWIRNPDKLVPGRGYWIPFSAAGTVYP